MRGCSSRFDELASASDLSAHQNAKGASVPTFVSRWPNLCVSDSNLYVSNHSRKSYVQIADFEGVFFDELAAGFDFVAHENAEEVVGGAGVFHADL